MDINKICRVCLRSDLELHFIFDEKFVLKSHNLAEILTECTMYKVSRYDKLPHQICGCCRQLAINAFLFKRDCEKAYRKLISMLAGDSFQSVNSSSQVMVKNGVLVQQKFTQTDDSTMYPCERCEQKFFTFDSLRAHRENEHKGGAIVCRFCSKSFNRVGYLKTHIAVFHPESGYTSHNQCIICQRQFTRREHMRRHLAVVHKFVEIVDMPELSTDRVDKSSGCEDKLSEQPMVDELSSIELEGLPELDSNLFAAVSSNVNMSTYSSYTCASENNDSRTESKFQPMQYDEEDEKPLAEFIRIPRKAFSEVLINESNRIVSLEEVAKEFDIVKRESAALLEGPSGDDARQYNGLLQVPTASSASSNEDNEYKCQKCSQIFQRSSILQRHICQYEQEKPFTTSAAKVFKCDECDMEFTHASQRRRHKEAKHSSKTSICEICQKSFKSKFYMQRHIALHSKKRFVCKECSARFVSREELKAHIKAENHDKPLLCPECGLRCKTANLLMVHMRRHKGEKPFKCKFCSKGFPRMDDLRIHEKYHTGEKSHFCETCGKGFQRKYNLAIHMRVHTGEKPYKCHHCPHAFTQSNDLKVHIRRHTGERFRCDICGAPFMQGYQMRQHKLAEHGVKVDPPTQRLEKYTSPAEQEQQIKQNMQRELEKSICSSRANVVLEPHKNLSPFSNIEIVHAAYPPADMNFLN